jgi:serine/threonine protein kinase/WD40 repeat protein
MLEAGLGPADNSAGLEAVAARQTFGDYELIEEIARGGMGVVFRARQVSLHRLVALKMILRGEFATPAELARFRAEAETAAQLQHPNIVAIHEVGERDGQPFFCMDLVEGRNLAEVVANTPLAPRRAANYLQTVAGAVHYAHTRGVLHRDLKPSNVLIDADDQPRVTDFGLAKRLDRGCPQPQRPRHSNANEPAGAPSPSESAAAGASHAPDPSLTHTGQVLGSPNFMPPEQAAGKHRELTPAADVYSLGAMLYHTLTGRPPFVAETLTATLRLVAESEPIAPRSLVPTVPLDLETICLKCLAKEPSRRYASAQALADELGRFLRDEPIHARPAGRAEKFWRWCRRHPALASVSAVAVLLLAAVAIISTTMAARLQRANQEGQEKLRESLLAQARATRWSGRPGRRFESLDALAKAAAIRLGADLRNEAIAAMSMIDVRPIKSWHLPDNTYFGIDEAYTRYMRAPTNGPFTLHRVANDEELARIVRPPGKLDWIALSSTGDWCAVYADTGTPRLDMYRWGQSNVVFTVTNLFVRSLHFQRGDQRMAIAGWSRAARREPRVLVLDLPGARVVADLDAHTVPSVCLSPSGDRVIVFGGSSRLQIRRLPAGEVLQTLTASGKGIYSVAWQDDERRLAAGGVDGNVYLWDLEQEKPDSTLLRHGSVVTGLTFSPDGNWIASGGWDSQWRLWEVASGRLLFRQAAGGPHRFAPAGGRLAITMSPTRVDLCEIGGAREFKSWLPGRKVHGSVSPDGSLFATPDPTGVRLWSRANGRAIGLLPESGATFALFPTVGSTLITASPAGLRKWELSLKSMDSTNRVEAVRHALFCDGRSLGNVALDREGKRVAVVRDGWLEAFESDTGRSLFSRSRQVGMGELSWPVVSLSPDGEWLATYEWSGGGAHVWRLGATDRGSLLEPGANGVAFSSDGQWLVTGTGKEYVFREIGTWRVVRRIPRPSNAGIHAVAVFSPDRRTAVLRWTERTFGLYDTRANELLATLESPDDTSLGSFGVSGDGSILTVPDLDSGGIHMWDLRAIRQQLASMGLDWSAPAFPDVAPDPMAAGTAEWQVRVIQGLAALLALRDPRCTARQIDLTDHYNAVLTNGWFHPDWKENNLSSLPQGLVELDGAWFDVRGVIQLGRTDPELAFPYPRETSAIPVQQVCQKLHFLHATGWAGKAGDEVGEYVIRYQDGAERSVSITYQENIWGWWDYLRGIPPLKPETSEAWRGRNAMSGRDNMDLVLFHFRWENPRPEVTIASITFRSRMTPCAPFLVALTAE